MFYSFVTLIWKGNVIIQQYINNENNIELMSMTFFFLKQCMIYDLFLNLRKEEKVLVMFLD